jgi:hypothetical protein
MKNVWTANEAMCFYFVAAISASGVIMLSKNWLRKINQSLRRHSYLIYTLQKKAS